MQKMSEEIALYCLKADSESYSEVCEECSIYGNVGCDHCYNDAINTAIQALEEIQQYRAIGTVEEIDQKIAELARWHTNKINKNIKNVFAYTSTLICHNCDHKDDYIEELEAEVAEYRAIGTVDQCREAVERMKPKKPIEYEDKYYGCPKCGNALMHKWEKYPTILNPKRKGLPSCWNCLQVIDWSE